MPKWIFLISIAVTLSGCCGSITGCGVGPSPRLLAWDDLNPENPNRLPKRSTRIIHSKPPVTVAAKIEQPSDKEVELAALPKYSPQWWSLHDQIEADADARLTRMMNICRQMRTTEPDQSNEMILRRKAIQASQGYNSRPEAAPMRNPTRQFTDPSAVQFGNSRLSIFVVKPAAREIFGVEILSYGRSQFRWQSSCSRILCKVARRQLLMMMMAVL